MGAFAILYLAAGLRRFAGFNWLWVLVWPKEAGSLWGNLGIELGGFALVALLVYRLRLQGLGFGTSVVPPRVYDTPIRASLHANPAFTAAAVFLGLYLAVGVGLGGIFNVASLLWPYHMSGAFMRAVLLVLFAFAGVSLYVWWIKGQYLIGLERLVSEMNKPSAPRSGPLETELAGCREEVEALRGNLENSNRHAAEARKRAADAETKLRETEAKLRSAGLGGGGDSDGDDKFRLAKNAFARLYHPDTVKAEGLDRLIRAEIFKEYWRELEAIEKGAKR